MVIAKECLHIGYQLLLLREQGKPAKIMMKYTVYIYYSEHRTSGMEHFEMVNIYGNCKGMIAQKKPTPPPTEAR